MAAKSNSEERREPTTDSAREGSGKSRKKKSKGPRRSLVGRVAYWSLVLGLWMFIGALGLTDHEEDLIVIFLGTLTDGFTTPYPDADKYTGNCLPPTVLSPPPPPVSAAPVPPGLTPPSH